MGIVGGGTVGRATARAFMEHADVAVYDVVPERRTTGDLSAVLAADVVFVCLPTPQKAGALAADLAAVEHFFAEASRVNRHANYVLRSTVPVGTTRALARRHGLPNLVHSPEFLTARCAVADSQVPAQLVIGAPADGTTTAHARPCPRLLRKVYEVRFPGVPVRGMTSDESELAKLVLNSFFAVKVSFFNEARAYADAAEADWASVMSVVLGDGRVAHAHTTVPGRDGFGFSGSCLPKDLADFIDCVEQAPGCSAPVARAALERNKADRKRGAT